jgi:formamidopyrimidine-DNA glycosylase
MPELPEVETARALIAARGLNRRIVAVDDTDSYVCRPHAPGEIAAALTGRTLTAAHRRGKTMWCETSPLDPRTSGPAVPGPDLGLHLGMSGRVVIESPGQDGPAWGGEPFRRDAQPARAVWDRFRLDFADGGSLVLFDKRRLARVRLNPDITALGPDAGEVTPAQFRELVTRGSVAVKARLLDQSKLAGVGNLLADEALWQARISPSAPVTSLRPATVRRLYGALERSLAAAQANGGVHTGEVIAARRPGGACPRCGAPMRHGVVGGRSTWWCSREQALAGQ